MMFHIFAGPINFDDDPVFKLVALAFFVYTYCAFGLLLFTLTRFVKYMLLKIFPNSDSINQLFPTNLETIFTISFALFAIVDIFLLGLASANATFGVLVSIFSNSYDAERFNAQALIVGLVIFITLFQLTNMLYPKIKEKFNGWSNNDNDGTSL